MCLIVCVCVYVCNCMFFSVSGPCFDVCVLICCVCVCVCKSFYACECSTVAYESSLVSNNLTVRVRRVHKDGIECVCVSV